MLRETRTTGSRESKWEGKTRIKMLTPGITQWTIQRVWDNIWRCSPGQEGRLFFLQHLYWNRDYKSNYINLRSMKSTLAFISIATSFLVRKREREFLPFKRRLHFFEETISFTTTSLFRSSSSVLKALRVSFICSSFSSFEERKQEATTKKMPVSFFLVLWSPPKK